MLTSGILIYRILRRDKTMIRPLNVNAQRQQRQDRIQKQMLILAICSVVIFLCTSVPFNIRRAYGSYEINVLQITNLYYIVTHNGILTVVASFNYAVSI